MKNKWKDDLYYFTVIVLFIVAIGGCKRWEYKQYKKEHPNGDVWSFLYNSRK